MTKAPLLLLLACMSLQVRAQQGVTLPCNINMSSNKYACMDLRDTIKNILIERDTHLFRYGSLTPNNSPTDYNFRRSPLQQSCNDSGNALVFTITYPANYSYSTCNPLPCIALFHAGGYVESNATGLVPNDFDNYVNGFAKRGYIVFNVQYRTGWDIRTLQGLSSTDNPAPQLMAAYRAAQDIRGFLRSLRKMSADGTFDSRPYKFDINKLYLGGCSAGAFLCINAAYLSQNEVLTGAPGLKDVLGPLNKPKTGEYYYGSDSIPLPNINGVASMWGAGIGELSGLPDVATFLDANSPPLIGFTGEVDQVAPYTSLVEYINMYPSNQDITQCGNIVYPVSTYNSNGTAPDFRLYGNLSIYNRLHQLGIPSEVYLDSDMGHGLNNNGVYDTAANFGLVHPTEEQVITYIVGRVATFFQAVRSGHYSTLDSTKFVDKKNCRYGNQADWDCTGPAPANNCPNNNLMSAKQQLSGGDAFTLAPNPASGGFRIATEGTMEELMIYNAYGQAVFHKQVHENNISISREELGKVPAGIYIVSVRVEGRWLRRKLELL